MSEDPFGGAPSGWDASGSPAPSASDLDDDIPF